MTEVAIPNEQIKRDDVERDERSNTVAEYRREISRLFEEKANEDPIQIELSGPAFLTEEYKKALADLQSDIDIEIANARKQSSFWYRVSQGRIGNNEIVEALTFLKDEIIASSLHPSVIVSFPDNIDASTISHFGDETSIQKLRDKLNFIKSGATPIDDSNLRISLSGLSYREERGGNFYGNGKNSDVFQNILDVREEERIPFIKKYLGQILAGGSREYVINIEDQGVQSVIYNRPGANQELAKVGFGANSSPLEQLVNDADIAKIKQLLQPSHTLKENALGSS